MEVSDQLDDPAALPSPTPHPDKVPRYPWSREPGRPHSQSGRFQTNLLPLPGFEPQIVQPVIALVNAVLQPVYKTPNFYGPYTERLQSIQQSHLLQCPDRVTELLPRIRDILGSNSGPDKLLTVPFRGFPRSHQVSGRNSASHSAAAAS